MKKLITLVLILSQCIMSWSQAFIDPNTPADVLPANANIGANWELDFSDEFNNSELDINKWEKQNSSKSRSPRPDLSINDWWWKPENVWVAEGNLVLEVVKHDYNTMYCGSVNTNNIYETTYGYFEARIKIADASKGTHTALWFQGDNMSQVDGTGNDGAELDIFESAWLGDYTKSVVHIDGYASSHQANTKQYNTPGIHSGYHTWGFYWTSEYMKIYYDGELKVTYSGSKWIPQNDEFIWLSNGASFGISGDYFTSQPDGTLTHTYVDYIRAWKESAGQTDLSKSFAEGIIVYPNSFTDLFTISGLVEKCSIQILDSTGRIVESLLTEDYEISIDFNSHLSGIYFVRLSNNLDNSQNIYRIIKM